MLYKRVENHWRKTPEYKELEFGWVPEDVTRLATLLSGEVHIYDVPRALQKDAAAKGMNTLPGMPEFIDDAYPVDSTSYNWR